MFHGNEEALYGSKFSAHTYLNGAKKAGKFLFGLIANLEVAHIDFEFLHTFVFEPSKTEKEVVITIVSSFSR